MTYGPKRTIYLPIGDFLDFELQLMETRPGVKPKAFLTELMLRWLTTDKERLALRKNVRAMRGFQWKNIFLPDGTSLRTNYCGNVEFAKVVGDHIVSDDGTALTPSLFVSGVHSYQSIFRYSTAAVNRSRSSGEIPYLKASP